MTTQRRRPGVSKAATNVAAGRINLGTDDYEGERGRGCRADVPQQHRSVEGAGQTRSLGVDWKRGASGGRGKESAVSASDSAGHSSTRATAGGATTASFTA